MANIISNIIDDKQDVKNQLGTIPDVIPSIKQFQSSLKVEHHSRKIYENNIAGAMIWGSSNFGVFGTAKWGDIGGGSFILNSSSFGVLGTGKLGGQTILRALYAVIPNNNLFTEYFHDTQYIDLTNSTGTINTTSESYSLLIGEVIQSEIIAKPRSAISTVKFFSNDDITDAGDGMTLPFILDSSTFGSDTVSIKLSNNNGATWYEANEGEILTFPTTTSDDELLYKITANEDVVISNKLIIQINA